MSGYLSNKRPSSSTDWGVGNNDFNNRFIEPTTLKKQTGYNDGDVPTAVAFNWILNNIHKWIKNLDERTAKVAVHTWTVNNAVSRPTDRDFDSLASALASPNVYDGDTLLVSSQESLLVPVTITKSVKLIFTHDSYFYGAIGNTGVKFILDTDNIQIVGGQFYSFAGSTFELTANAEHCSIEGCYFNTADPIDDSAVPPGKFPSIRGLRYYVF